MPSGRLRGVGHRILFHAFGATPSRTWAQELHAPAGHAKRRVTFTRRRGRHRHGAPAPARPAAWQRVISHQLRRACARCPAHRNARCVRQRAQLLLRHRPPTTFSRSWLKASSTRIHRPCRAAACPGRPRASYHYRAGALADRQASSSFRRLRAYIASSPPTRPSFAAGLPCSWPRATSWMHPHRFRLRHQERRSTRALRGLRGTGRVGFRHVMCWLRRAIGLLRYVSAGFLLTEPPRDWPLARGQRHLRMPGCRSRATRLGRGTWSDLDATTGHRSKDM